MAANGIVPTYTRNGASTMSRNGRMCSSGCIGAGKNCNGIIIPERAYTIGTASQLIPSPDTVQSIDIVTMFINAQFNSRASSVRPSQPIAAPPPAGAFRPKHAGNDE